MGVDATGACLASIKVHDNDGDYADDDDDDDAMWRSYGWLAMFYKCLYKHEY